MFFIGKHLIKTRFLLAPMAGVSEMPFRIIAGELGAGLATTELISAKGICQNSERARKYLRFNKEKEIPYSVQLFGGEEKVMAEAAVYVAKLGANIIDINFGCPVKKVTKTGAGSAFLKTPIRIFNLIKTIKSALGNEIPITAKIRSGWDADQINFLEVGKILEDAGCEAIAIHGRTRAQGYAGLSDWGIIKKLKDCVKIPVIGNGDIISADQANVRLLETNCDAVMIGRGALGNPWIFQELKYKKKPNQKEIYDLIIRHLDEHLEYNSIKSFRNHLIWYSKGYTGNAQFRSLVAELTEINHIKEIIGNFFLNTVKENNSSIVTHCIDYRQAFG